MTVALTVLAWILIGTGAFYLRQSGNLHDKLVAYRTPMFQRAEGRWPAPPDLRYRPEGWPLVTALRRALFRAYVCAIAGVVLLMAVCPAASR